ncbi:MAG: hypothetical protein IPP22_00715 [Nitrosomonas sp.]|nr:hypothetical protein [Nitrosomonas sp.]
MNWTTPRDLKAQLSRFWERGELLQPLVTNEPVFPLQLKLKSPGSADLTGRFEAVRAWIAELKAMPQIRIEWREIRHRVQGLQRLPESVWVDAPDSAFALLAKQRDVKRFEQIVNLTRDAQPALLPWLARRPLQAIELADQWPQLLAIVRWLAGHPRPGIYLRQVDIPGIHSKFIETHRTVLAELLDRVLPATAVTTGKSGVNQFAARYGFLEKPARIHFRVLDAQIKLLPGTELPIVSLDDRSFAQLKIPLRHVFITENEINFLAFPLVRDAIVIFGSGYGWDALARAQWLMQCRIHYWGDIDTHGFAILNQLRFHFAHATSLLMDRATLMAHQELWGEEPDPVVHDLSRLTGIERALFDELRDNRIRKGLRLEQERIGFHWATAAVQAIAAQHCKGE